MRTVIAFALFAAASAEVAFKETFGEGWEDRWVMSTARTDAGKFTVSPGEWFGEGREAEDAGLFTSEAMRFYATGSKMAAPTTTKGKDLVLQFSVKHEKREYSFCGGGYIKLLAADTDLDKFDGDTPYSVMFGPDMCGYDVSRIHLIFNFDGENLLKTEDIKLDYSDKNEFTEFKGNFRTRIATYKLQTEAEEIEQFTQDLKILLTRRLQVNRQAVEGANLKLAASPAVGCGAWFLMAHHILCLPAAACFGWMQVKSAAQKHNKEMPAALADPEVLKDAAANLTEFGRNRVRDVQAMQVALSRCSPQNMVSGFNDATQGIGAAGRSALGNSGSHTAQEQANGASGRPPRPQ